MIISTLEGCIEFCIEKQNNIKLKTDPKTFWYIQRYLETLQELKGKIEKCYEEMNVKNNTHERNAKGLAVWEEDI